MYLRFIVTNVKALSTAISLLIRFRLGCGWVYICIEQLITSVGSVIATFYIRECTDEKSWFWLKIKCDTSEIDLSIEFCSPHAFLICWLKKKKYTYEISSIALSLQDFFFSVIFDSHPDKNSNADTGMQTFVKITSWIPRLCCFSRWLFHVKRRTNERGISDASLGKVVGNRILDGLLATARHRRRANVKAKQSVIMSH